VLRAIEVLNRGELVKALELRARPPFSRMGRHRDAAVEFQKVLDHPGMTLNDPIGPMERLQLAIACSASGDPAQKADSVPFA
jgi:hypothetical protein